MVETPNNPWVGLRITDNMSGVSTFSVIPYKREHARRIAKKRSTFFYTYRVEGVHGEN